MKKLILMIVVLVLGTQVYAQETQKRELVKNGDLIEATIFHDNGLISQEGQYNLDGTLQGTWISYDVNGNKTAVAKYNNGEKVGTWLFYEGDVLKEVKYSNSKVAQVTTWKEGETQIVSNFE
ncbi:MAG: nicotinic acid mononucleotide adenyltransferase [Flavobacteriaceae bacterium]|nr:nicotinic acid mononucleotide adenyltransferase [Flavobacteriaceae bacterium]